MAVRTVEQRQRRAENERKRYVKRRLKELQASLPNLTPVALRRASLRQISARARKAGGQPMCNDLRL